MRRICPTNKGYNAALREVSTVRPAAGRSVHCRRQRKRSDSSFSTAQKETAPHGFPCGALMFLLPMTAAIATTFFGQRFALFRRVCANTFPGLLEFSARLSILPVCQPLSIRQSLPAPEDANQLWNDDDVVVLILTTPFLSVIDYIPP